MAVSRPVKRHVMSSQRRLMNLETINDTGLVALAGRNAKRALGDAFKSDDRREERIVVQACRKICFGKRVSKPWLDDARVGLANKVQRLDPDNSKWELVNIDPTNEEGEWVQQRPFHTAKTAYAAANSAILYLEILESPQHAAEKRNELVASASETVSQFIKTFKSYNSNVDVGRLTDQIYLDVSRLAVFAPNNLGVSRYPYPPGSVKAMISSRGIWDALGHIWSVDSDGSSKQLEKCIRDNAAIEVLEDYPSWIAFGLLGMLSSSFVQADPVSGMGVGVFAGIALSTLNWIKRNYE